MLRHLDRMLTFYGRERGLVLFRKHASRYLSPYRLPDPLRENACSRAKKPDEFTQLLADIVPARAV